LHIFYATPHFKKQARPAPISWGIIMAFYWDNTVKHDRPLITNCFVPGLARSAGLHPSSATDERDLDTLLTNVALADQEGRPLSYSRHRDHDYRGITFGRALSGVATIVKADLALERRTKPGHRGWQSDLRGLPALTEIFDRHGADPIYGPSDPIILRSRRDGSQLPLKPMRDRLRQVEAANEMLASLQLDLSMTGAIELRNNLWRFERLEYDRFDSPHLVKQIVRFDRMAGRRVFTNKTRFHGRFYCPAQNIPSTARLLMTMSGEQVVELDFQSMHVALAYHLCGALLDGDPYEGVPGFTRKQAKLGLLTAFNATSIAAAVSALTDARKGKPVVTNRKDAVRLIEILKVRHAPIAEMLCSDAGMTLMSLDSRIMLAAVDRLIASGILCIPIHDSILVAQQHEDEAREALNYGWCGILTNQRAHLTPCNIEKKQPKVPQDGYEGSVGVSVPVPDYPGPGDGWWASVLEEARLDVAEWAA
jgi:hypothetical protein